MKTPTLTRAIYALIGEEEQKEEKERNKERDSNPVTLDHSVASYDLHESYGSLILNLSPLAGGYIYIL